MNSIDVLEETLDIIYKLRMTSIQSRMKQSATLSNTKREQQSSRMKTRESKDINNLHDLIANPKVNKEPIPTSLNNKMMSEFNQLHNFNSSTTNGYSNKNNFYEIDNSYGDNNASNSFTKVKETQEDDEEGISESTISLINEFKNELMTWNEINKTKNIDDDEREEFCDYLSEKYMCRKFDLIKTNIVISKLRKELIKIIENFATDGLINFNNLQAIIDKCHFSKPNNNNSNNNNKEIKTEGNSRNKTYSISKNKNSLDMEILNKTKIRDQYNAYIKLKNEK